MVQEVRVGCVACGRESRLGSVSSEGRRTMSVSGCQVVCPHCERRITVEGGVYSYNPTGATPTYRAAPATLA